jgi:hypothetical protein
MAYVQYDNEVDGLDEMFRISDDARIFAPAYRVAIEKARDALDDFLAEAWEFEDEIASEDLKVARFDEIAEAIAQVTGLEVYLVGDCLTVIAGAALPNDEYHDDIHDILVRYFLED